MKPQFFSCAPPFETMLCSLQAKPLFHNVPTCRPLSPSPSRLVRFQTRSADQLLFIRLNPCCFRMKLSSCIMLSESSKEHRKSRGYWSVKANVVEELQRFARNAQSPHRMPTAAQLLAAGHADLLRAVQRYGGFAEIANRSGLIAHRRRRGFWSDDRSDESLSYISDEINKLQNANATERGTLPSANNLRALGRGDLVTSILSSGGFSTVSHALNFSSPRRGRPRLREASRKEEGNTKKSPAQHGKRASSKTRKCSHYWRTWRFLELELRSFALTYCEGHMPLQRQLIRNSRSDLANAVRIHGGFARVARRAGLTPALSVECKRPKGYWTDPAVLHGELLTFTTKYGYPGVMPRRDQLLKAGRSDIVYAIQKHGGYSAIAAELHLVWHGPSSFWRVFRNLQRRVLAFVKKHDMESNMPSVEVLHDHGRIDLIHGIALHGGVMVVARRTGLNVTFPKRGVQFWEQPRNVQLELEALNMKRPLEKQRCMPSSVALVQAGRADLATAIRDHGGWVYYGQRLGLRFAFEVREQGFWQRDANVVMELVSYVDKRYGTWEFPGKSHNHDADERRKRRKQTFIPCLQMLKRDGRSDIAFALERYHGGIESFAKKYDFKIAADVVSTKPAEALMKWSVFSSELEEWILRHGSRGIMPARQDLIRTGRHDLRFAMYKHGGTESVSNRLQYVHAESSLDQWLPEWLGLQAGRLGLLLQISKKAVLSKTDQMLMNTINQYLQGNVTEECRGDMKNVHCLIQESSLLGRRYRRESHRGRRGVRDEQVGRISHKLTQKELKELRKKYKHFPADDIIRI